MSQLPPFDDTFALRRKPRFTLRTLADAERSPDMSFPASSDLITAEAQLGRSLPPDLRARLIADNGGEIEAVDDDWQMFPVWDPTDRHTQRRTANHIVRENASLRDWPGLPAGFVAIAANGTGDLLGLLPGSDGVHWFDHERRTVESVDLDWRLT